MIISNSNWEDVRRYYLHCYIKTKETGDHVWFVEQVDSKMVFLVDCNNEQAALDLSKPYELEYVIPGRAAFQYGKHAWALVRAPHKQYYRGMHAENTRFASLTDTGRWAVRTINFDIIQAFVEKPVYYKIQDVVNLYQQEAYISYALSPNICVTNSGIIVTVSGSVIGKLMMKSKRVTCNKLFIPELTKLGVFSLFKPTKESPPKKSPVKETEGSF